MRSRAMSRESKRGVGPPSGSCGMRDRFLTKKDASKCETVLVANEFYYCSCLVFYSSFFSFSVNTCPYSFTRFGSTRYIHRCSVCTQTDSVSQHRSNSPDTGKLERPHRLGNTPIWETMTIQSGIEHGLMFYLCRNGILMQNLTTVSSV
jgi:hypothetical protein